MFGVVLVRIFRHSDWMRTRITPNKDTFHAVITSWQARTPRSCYYGTPLVEEKVEDLIEISRISLVAFCFAVNRKIVSAWSMNFLMIKYLLSTKAVEVLLKSLSCLYKSLAYILCWMLISWSLNNLKRLRMKFRNINYFWTLQVWGIEPYAVDTGR